MSTNVGAFVAVYIMFSVTGLIGAWDGLVRHHIRVRPGEWLPILMLQGLPAALLGLTCLLLLLFLGDLAWHAIQATAIGCKTPYCALTRILVPPFTEPLSPLFSVLFIGIFCRWLWGIGDRAGPFRTRLLAWGVWYRERDVVARVQQRLEKARKPSVDVDAILMASDGVLRRFHGISPTMAGYGSSDEPMSRAQTISMVVHSPIGRDHKRFPESSRRVLLETITEYAIDRLELAERRWPWRRQLFMWIR